ncbi:hypothetical protein GCM10011504_08450 [Siccirubricoccus deserti]|jgi:hypothetical protein|uniref:Uncharacterized protein n=1 Tax=Siccirubricoccus deserti TaxID=2013562 RepID=A0A9X0QV80_9PROT|nr:hypothetical protein [Siccirubricoccus deserti]MBC4014480.1 hypothetical protein [Siccirubricoccus deserti]GGC32567.1 hypothetical protein GCM10011504_08450 [Siccirubricoccus deserti]
MPPAIILLALLLLAACGPGGLRAGGQYSGVPDTTVGDWRSPLGTLSTGGTITLNRELPPRL